MQGGIHPRYTGVTYLSILDAAKSAVSDMHVHAFSPLEVHHGATSLGLDIGSYLDRLRGAGLGSLPGTAAEILDDEVRAVLCPTSSRPRNGSPSSRRRIAAAFAPPRPSCSAMSTGRSTGRDICCISATCRSAPAASPNSCRCLSCTWKRHFIYGGRARKGPTFRETVLMHAVSRLVLHPLIPNIQVSWVKLGPDGAAACLTAGANDLGGTLMNESISRAAGTEHGQEFSPEQMDALIASLGRTPRQRTTLYKDVPNERRAASYRAAALAPLVYKRASHPRAAVVG